MGDLLGGGIKALLGFQRAITTVSKNIANVNNADYSRQTGVFVSTTGGVELQVDRNVDEFVWRDLRATTSLYEESDIFYAKQQTFESFIDNSSTNINEGMNLSFNSLQKVLTDPANNTSRDEFLNYMQALKNRFQTVGNELSRQSRDVNGEISGLTTEVNTMLEGIASLNDQITKDTTGNLGLFDNRDALLRKLSGMVGINTIANSDKSVTVTIGAGSPLVVGNKAGSLSVSANAEDPTQLDVVANFQTASNIVTDSLSGGKIAGTLAFRDQLNDMKNELGRLAIVVADQLNTQNKLGMDLNGDIGGDIFTDLTAASASRVQANSGNALTSTALSVAIDDATALTTSDYRLTVADNAGTLEYSLRRLSDNVEIETGSLAAVPATITADEDGFTINVATALPADGDSFLIMPTRRGTTDMSVAMTSSRKLAMAMPIRTVSDTDNIGTGVATVTAVTDTSTSAFTTTPRALSPPYSVRFITPTTYQIYNDSTNTAVSNIILYDPTTGKDVFPVPAGSMLSGVALDPGYRVQVTGVPQANDRFDIQYNTGGVSDNRNGLLMAEIQKSNVLEDGTQTLADAYLQTLSGVATRGQAAKLSRESNFTLKAQIENRRASLSGVNLDEEGANLLAYQQAYEASAKLISIASETFRTLIDAVR